MLLYQFKEQIRQLQDAVVYVSVDYTRSKDVEFKGVSQKTCFVKITATPGVRKGEQSIRDADPFVFFSDVPQNALESILQPIHKSKILIHR
jgi:hypothetical protein